LAGIRLDGLVWDAGGRFVLDGSAEDVLTVPPGDVAVVVAEQSPEHPVATVFADVVVGLAVPVAGTVRVEGSGWAEGRPDPRVVALVPAGGGLLPQRSVAQNIAYGIRAGHSAASRKRRVSELAELFAVAAVLGVRPHRLSPSQRLHVAAARALASLPHAVVVEDRAGQPGCGPVTALIASRDVAVLAVTNSVIRAEALTEHIYYARPDQVASPATAQPAQTVQSGDSA
jgi:iron(III) transport system ATP-binding protein